MRLLALILLLPLALRLLGIIHWPWIWITASLWMPCLGFLFFALLVACGGRGPEMGDDEGRWHE